jgi:signal recognition particle GTPase
VSGEKNQFADYLSRLVPDYRAAFSSRMHVFSDVKREMIKLPEEWLKTPNVLLTTQDIMESLKDSVMNEVCSENVKKKRLASYNQILEEIMEESMINSIEDDTKKAKASNAETIHCNFMQLKKGKTIGKIDPKDPEVRDPEGDINLDEKNLR